MPLYPSLASPCHLSTFYKTPLSEYWYLYPPPWDSALFDLECGLGIHIVIQWYHACSFIFIYAMSVGGRRWSCRRTLGIHALFHQPLFYSLQVAVQSYKHAGSSTQVNTETRQLEVMLTPEEHGKSMTIEWAASWIGGELFGEVIFEKGLVGNHPNLREQQCQQQPWGSN